MRAQLWTKIQTYWAEDAHRKFLWSPVFLGLGIGLYFFSFGEPSLLILAVFPLILFMLLWIKGSRIIIFPCLMISLGILIMSLRTHSLATVLLNHPQYQVQLKGRVGLIETLPSEEKRITLRLEDQRQVRLKLKGEISHLLQTGDVIQGVGHLFPFLSPLIHGSYHFRRQAFFQNLSAQGILKAESVRVLKSEPALFSFQALRRALTEKIYAALPSEKGAIAAALLTGEKTRIPSHVREDYTNSGLSHILAISGLHVGLLASFIFLFFRQLLTLHSSLSLKCHTKKIAAFLCIPLLLFYMAISGFGMPVIRSFLMTTIVLLGIMLDRISISMNMIAIAAFVILMLFPESLIHPSFQLSFAAVFALIGVYESAWVQKLHSSHRGWRKIMLYILSLASTSVVATLATFPLTISTFNRFTLHAIEANMLGVPLMGFWIMPWGVLSFLLMPFGLERLALIPMGLGISYLNTIAHEVASWQGSNITISTPPFWALIMVTLSLIWIGLWKAKWRWWSGPFLCLGIYGFIISTTPKPDLLFDPRVKSWALRDGDVFLTYPSAKKFEIELWARALGVERIETIDPLDKRFKCTARGCFLKKQKIYVKFPNASRKGSLDNVLIYWPQKSAAKRVQFRHAGQGFFTPQGFNFVPLAPSKRPWD